jgi:hypothetical protein
MKSNTGDGEFALVACESAQGFEDPGTFDTVDELTDFETRVLGVLEQRSGLDVEQVASAARLPVGSTTRALEGLARCELITEVTGKFGSTYQLDRSNVIKKLIAA